MGHRGDCPIHQSRIRDWSCSHDAPQVRLSTCATASKHGPVHQQPVASAGHEELEMELLIRGSIIVQQQRSILLLEDNLSMAWAEVSRSCPVAPCSSRGGAPPHPHPHPRVSTALPFSAPPSAGAGQRAARPSGCVRRAPPLLKGRGEVRAAFSVPGRALASLSSLSRRRSLPGLAPRRHGANDPQALAQPTRTKGGVRSICRRGSARKHRTSRRRRRRRTAASSRTAAEATGTSQPATAAPAQRPGRLPSTHGCDSAPVQAHQVRTLAQREAYLSDARCLGKLAGVYDSAPHSTA